MTSTEQAYHTYTHSPPLNIISLPCSLSLCGVCHLLQDTVRFVFGHRGHHDPEVYSLEQLLPARWGLWHILTVRQVNLDLLQHTSPPVVQSTRHLCPACRISGDPDTYSVEQLSTAMQAVGHVPFQAGLSCNNERVGSCMIPVCVHLAKAQGVCMSTGDLQVWAVRPTG